MIGSFPHRSPVAGLADVELARAFASRSLVAAGNRFNSAGPIALDASIAAPTNSILAAALVTPKASGQFVVNFTALFSLAAAAIVTVAVVADYPCTGMSGGGGTSTFRTHTGGAVTLSGALGSTALGPEAQDDFATANIAACSLTCSGMVLVPQGTQAALVFACTSSGTLQNSAIIASYFELP